MSKPNWSTKACRNQRATSSSIQAKVKLKLMMPIQIDPAMRSMPTVKASNMRAIWWRATLRETTTSITSCKFIEVNTAGRKHISTFGTVELESLAIRLSAACLSRLASACIMHCLKRKPRVATHILLWRWSLVETVMVQLKAKAVTPQRPEAKPVRSQALVKYSSLQS